LGKLGLWVLWVGVFWDFGYFGTLDIVGLGILGFGFLGLLVFWDFGYFGFGCFGTFVILGLCVNWAWVYLV